MTLAKRLWIYQAERFPLIRTVPLLALFSAAAINVSALLADRPLPGPWAYLAGFLLGLILFFQMRVADEHKDYADDCRYRPERAVPRGLVSLPLLARLAGLAALIAAAIALTRPAPTSLCLLVVWGWLFLMTREFFAPDWLKARPILYLVSHMAILPLIDLMLTSLEWAATAPAPGLWLFLALSFVNGCVLEIGRKIWAPESERDGVETYSKLWGPRAGVVVWALIIAGAALLLILIGIRLGAGMAVGAVAALGMAAALLAAARFASAPDAKRERHVDAVAGLWVALSYLAAGFLPIWMTA